MITSNARSYQTRYLIILTIAFAKGVKHMTKEDQEMIGDLVKQETKKILDRRGENINCFDFYLAMKKVFPDAIAFYNGNHIITMIGACLYDKDGLKYYPLKLLEPEKYNNAHTWGDTALMQKMREMITENASFHDDHTHGKNEVLKELLEFAQNEKTSTT